MCRFVAYIGKERILLEEVLEKPENSLIKQSNRTRDRSRGINADGFGIAWYDFEIDDVPGVFKSIQPAWNDNNLINLSKKIKSSCFMAHVRASTVGDVSQQNCHPFVFENYALVHNGTIRNFKHYKRKILNKLDDDLFHKIRGNTDSESFFFLIMQFIKDGNNLENAVKEAIKWVVDQQKNEDDSNYSRINIVITDGKEIIATRFASKDHKNLSLNYSVVTKDDIISSLILSSEPLDSVDTSWHKVPENSYLHLRGDDMSFKIECL